MRSGGRILDYVDELLRKDGALSAQRSNFYRHNGSSRCLRFMFALNKRVIVDRSFLNQCRRIKVRLKASGSDSAFGSDGPLVPIFDCSGKFNFRVECLALLYTLITKSSRPHTHYEIDDYTSLGMCSVKAKDHNLPE